MVAVPPRDLAAIVKGMVDSAPGAIGAMRPGWRAAFGYLDRLATAA